MSLSRALAAALLLLATLLTACPSALAFRNGDHVRTRVHIDYPTFGIVNVIKRLCTIEKHGRNEGALIHDCRLDIIWEADDGTSIKESHSKDCCLGKNKNNGFRKTYDKVHKWSGDWKVRAEFHWKGGSKSPRMVASTPISSGSAESPSMYRPAVRVTLSSG